ncbi:MAG: PAS domain S-box-containing protein [Psychrosphaera sp.]|jgi:PAS domain S-box-containing protein
MEFGFGCEMKIENPNLYANKFKIHIMLVLVATFVFTLFFSIYTYELTTRLSALETSIHRQNDKVIQINSTISRVNHAIGFGGLIHNFKNYVIRNDSQNLDKMALDFDEFNTATEELTNLFSTKEELQAVEALRTMVSQYQRSLLQLQLQNIVSIKDRDAIAKVDDSEALKALTFLNNRTLILNETHKKQTELTFEQTSLWIFAGVALYFVVFLFAILLIVGAKRLKRVYADLTKALNESELLIANSPDAMLSITEKGAIIRCNEQLELLFGYTKTELLQQNLSMLMADNVKHKHQQYVQSYFDSPHRRLMGEGDRQLFGLHKNGKLIPIEVSLSSSVISGEKISTATIRDISARMEAENKLKVAVKLAESNYQKLQNAQASLNEKQMINIMLNKLPFGTMLLDDHAKPILINEKLLIETGYDKEELELLAFDRYIKVDDEKYRFLLNNLNSYKQKIEDENATFLGSLVAKRGGITPIEINLSTYTYNQQIYRLISFQNLTEIRMIEEKLVHSLERFTRVISAIEDGIWEWDIVDNSVNYSPQFMMIIGRENEANPQYNHWFEHIHPEYRARVEMALSAHLKTKEKYEVEYVGLNEVGEYNWFFSIGNSCLNDQNEPILMSGSLRNIHHRKLLEIALIEKSQFLNAIYEGSSHAIWVLDIEANNEFRFSEFNRTVCERLGVSAQEIENKRLSELTSSTFSSSNLLDVHQNYINCVKSKTQFDYIEYLKFNNREGWYKTSLYPIQNEQGDVVKIVGTAIDISEQKKSEKALEEHKLFLEKIIDSAVCGLYVFDLDGQKNVTINRRYTEILGYNIDELNDGVDFMTLFHPDDLPSVIEHMTKVAESKNGELYSLQYRFKSKGGNWVWCYSFDCIVKYTQDNRPELMLGTFVDITELTLLMDQLQESNDYLKRFAFVASHDLQEPLRKITAFSSSLTNRLQNEIKNDVSIEFEFSRLVNASERMREMIKDLLKLSKINSSALDMKPCSLSNILTQSMDLLSHLIEDHQVEFRLEQVDEVLLVDEGLMIQLFQNLIANSIKFMEQNSTPIIEIKSQKDNNNLTVIFKDNGIGVPEKFIEQIFEPFRRLNNKDSYSGSGIGLALCRQIIAIHKGTIVCKSEARQGATFIITLPLVVH